MGMDIKRDPKILRRKKIRNGIIIGILAIGATAATYAVSKLKPAAPSVPRSTVWTGVVKRGDFVREVRGAGTLVPEDIQWVAATTSGRIEKIVLRPGAVVKPGTVILEMSNPDLKQQANDAELSWRAAEAQLANLEANTKTTQLQLANAVSDAESALKVAQKDLEANQELRKQGIVAEFTVQQKQATVEAAINRVALAKKQQSTAIDTLEVQLAPQRATVNQAKARYEQFVRQLGDLQVKSTMTGLLQELDQNIQQGRQVNAGANLVRVSDPTKLKAEIRISETQTKDLAIGQLAKIDTRNGIVAGHVTRIDPSAVGGTVGVDVTLDEALPTGARPDQTVDGVVELQRLSNVVFVESPAFGQEDQAIQLFKLQPNGEAVRTTVKLGKRSVQYVQIIDGLKVGDEVVLSDMSPYDAFDRVRIN
ncbi:MAG: efflux RND transporter periplasmic adaptor subunit [Acidobacteriota bacterium]